MKNIKIFLWIVLVVLVALVFFQNRAFFTAGQELTLDLFVTDAFHAELPNAVWFLAILILGFLIAYFLGMVERFKAKKVIKGLNAQIASQREMLSQFRNNLGTGPVASPDASGPSTGSAASIGTDPLAVKTTPDD